MQPFPVLVSRRKNFPLASEFPAKNSASRLHPETLPYEYLRVRVQVPYCTVQDLEEQSTVLFTRFGRAEYCTRIRTAAPSCLQYLYCSRTKYEYPYYTDSHFSIMSPTLQWQERILVPIRLPDVHILVRCNVCAFGTLYHTVFDGKSPGRLALDPHRPPYSYSYSFQLSSGASSFIVRHGLSSAGCGSAAAAAAALLTTDQHTL